MSQPVLTQLESIAAYILGLSEVKLTPQTVASEVEGWDSLAHISVILEIEKQFKIKFSSYELEEMLNMGDLIRAIEKKRQ